MFSVNQIFREIGSRIVSMNHLFGESSFSSWIYIFGKLIRIILACCVQRRILSLYFNIITWPGTSSDWLGSVCDKILRRSIWIQNPSWKSKPTTSRWYKHIIFCICRYCLPRFCYPASKIKIPIKVIGRMVKENHQRKNLNI